MLVNAKFLVRNKSFDLTIFGEIFRVKLEVACILPSGFQTWFAKRFHSGHLIDKYIRIPRVVWFPTTVQPIDFRLSLPGGLLDIDIQ